MILSRIQQETGEIAGALADVFASLLALGDVLEVWRIANLVPSFRKVSGDNPGNDRQSTLNNTQRATVNQ